MAYHIIGLIHLQRREFRKALSEYDYSVKFLEADPDAYQLMNKRYSTLCMADRSPDAAAKKKARQ